MKNKHSHMDACTRIKRTEESKAQNKATTKNYNKKNLLLSINLFDAI